MVSGGSKPSNDRGNRILRLLDRALGIPIVFALGLLQVRARQFPARIDSIGILETAAIGDTVLLSAVLSDLRDAFPGAHIVLFAGDSNVEVARLLSGVDSVVRLPVRHL